MIESESWYTAGIKENLNEMIMDIKRRDFFRNFGRKTAAVAADAATPALIIIWTHSVTSWKPWARKWMAS